MPNTSISPAQVGHAGDGRTFSNAAAQLLKNAQGDPARLAYKAEAYKYAVESLKLKHHEAKLYALRAGGVYSYALGGARLIRAGLVSEDAFREVSQEVLRVSQARRRAKNDLTARGLTEIVDNIGVHRVDWDRMTDLSEATVSMDFQGNKAYDQASFSKESVPIPVIFHDVNLGIRALLASQNSGREQIDAAHIAAATEKVLQAEEKMIFSGDNVQFTGSSLYGYTTFPGRITDTVASNWVTDIANAQADVNKGVTALRDANKFGPYGLYVSNAMAGLLTKPVAGTATSTRSFILDQHSPELQFVEHTSFLAPGEFVLVSLDRTTVDLVIAQEAAPAIWSSPDGSGVNIRVMSSFAPRLKADAKGQSGIFHKTAVTVA